MDHDKDTTMNAMLKFAKSFKDNVHSASRDYADRMHRQRYAQEYEPIDRMVDEYLSSLSFVKMEKKKKNQSYKLLYLRRLLEEHKPRNILEFGSGSSSVVIKDYAKKAGATFTSVDESEDWAAQARKYICEDGDASIQVVYRKKAYDLSQDPPSIKYDAVFDGAYDFVFIDGPSLNAEDGTKIGNAANTDVFGLNPLPRVIAVDGRKSTALLIKQRYGDKYDVRLSDLFGKFFVGNGYDYLSVFVRKN